MRKIIIIISLISVITIMDIHFTKQNTEYSLLNSKIKLLTYANKNDIIDNEETYNVQIRKIQKEKDIDKDEVVEDEQEEQIPDYDIPLDKDKLINTSRHTNRRYIPIKAIVTAYAPYDNKSGICNDGTPDTTATGTKPKFGTLASDPKRIPYGTKLLIPEYGEGVVEDTGSALRKDKNNIRIDVFMKTYEEAMKWGKRDIVIYIIE